MSNISLLAFRKGSGPVLDFTELTGTVLKEPLRSIGAPKEPL